MRSRTAFAALPVALLVSGISLAEEADDTDPAPAPAPDPAPAPAPEPAPAPVNAALAKATVARSPADSPKLVEARARLVKAQKAAAAAEKQLPAVEKQIEKCQGNAARVRSACEDNCEETMRKCKAANYWRSNAQSACENRGEECNDRCSATEEKTCAALVSKKKKLEEVVEAQERRQPTGERCKGRYVVEDEGNGKDESGTGLVLDTKTNLRWLRFRGPRGLYHAQASSYCAGKGMRLPMRDEALAIAKESYCEAAWSSGWWTWTSTFAGATLAWYVDNNGRTNAINVDYGGNGDGALCVR